MPSLKACLATVALFALAMSPVAATPLESSAEVDVLSRRMSLPSAFEFPSLEKRESRKEASERVKLAKLRAARKAKRASTVKRSPSPSPAANMVSEDIEKRDTEKLELVTRGKSGTSLPFTRCYTDNICKKTFKSVHTPAHEEVYCNLELHQCAIGCIQGYQSSGGKCMKTTKKCGGTHCPTPPPNGVYRCSGKDKCTLSCNTVGGYSKKGDKCINTFVDPKNCGGRGIHCPSSYNGVGTPYCSGGRCSLHCPAHTKLEHNPKVHLKYCQKV